MPGETCATVDLHLHTTASDGRCTPEELVVRAAAAGLRTIAVTDHDTAAAVPAARLAAERLGIEVIAGIEITSVHGGKDVHILAYNLPDHVAEIEALTREQRSLRVVRARVIAERLADVGVPIDAERMVAEASQAGGKSIARPQIAQYLVAAGHVGTVAEAFERYLGEHAPAYVPHQGVSPAEVVAMVTRLGGVASYAHPGYTRRDEIIPDLVDAGLACIEAYHSSHHADTERHYLAVAEHWRLDVTGGSDYHGEGTRRAEFFGRVGLPPDRLERLRGRFAAAHAGALGPHTSQTPG